MKKCTHCQQEKPITEFYSNKKYKDGLFCYCKGCVNKKRLQWRRDNKIKEINNNLKRTYGITYEDKLKMLESQNFKCVVCKNEIQENNKAHVDHCHETGKVRGILCFGCNTGLGSFGDSIKRMESAIEYLKKSLLT